MEKDISTPLIDAARARVAEFEARIAAMPPLRWWQIDYWRCRWWWWRNGL
jgi:hypothetical protein